MLVRNYFYLNVIPKNYEIEGYDFEKWFWKKNIYLTKRKTKKSSQFIILPGYIEPKSTTTTSILIL